MKRTRQQTDEPLPPALSQDDLILLRKVKRAINDDAISKDVIDKYTDEEHVYDICGLLFHMHQKIGCDMLHTFKTTSRETQALNDIFNTMAADLKEIPSNTNVAEHDIEEGQEACDDLAEELRDLKRYADKTIEALATLKNKLGTFN